MPVCAASRPSLSSSRAFCRILECAKPIAPKKSPYSAAVIACYAIFRDYTAFLRPLQYPASTRETIEALKNFNVQHAITYIDSQLFNAVLAGVQQLEQTELAKEAIDDDRGGTEPPTRRPISDLPPRAPKKGHHAKDPEARRQAMERRNSAHHALVLAVRDRAKAAGFDFDSTQYADGLLSGDLFHAIFEMKSIKHDLSDLSKQIRIGVGQLHYYHFIHLDYLGFGPNDDVRLCLMLEVQPDSNLVSFLRAKKNIGTIWFRDGRVDGDSETKIELPWLFASLYAAA